MDAVEPPICTLTPTALFPFPPRLPPAVLPPPVLPPPVLRLPPEVPVPPVPPAPLEPAESWLSGVTRRFSGFAFACAPYVASAFAWSSVTASRFTSDSGSVPFSGSLSSPLSDILLCLL